MLGRTLSVIVVLPLAVLLVTLAVANRHLVDINLDPFRPEAPALVLTLPLYVVLLGTLIAGVILGGTATWWGQRRHRREARKRGAEARRWHEEADRLVRERDLAVAKRSQDGLPAPERRSAA